MEGLLIIIAIYGGLYLIGWLFEKIEKWNEERKIQIRDSVAQKIIPQTDITPELIELYKTKLNDIGYTNNSSSDFWRYYLSGGRKTYMGLVGKCPACEKGYTRIVTGKFGKFLGCNEYPKCKYTKNIDAAKQEYQDQSHKEFFDLFNLAYK